MSWFRLSREQGGHSRIARRLACTAGAAMYSRGSSEHYRRLALAAKERAAQSSEPQLKRRSKTLRDIGWRLPNELRD